MNYELPIIYFKKKHSKIPAYLVNENFIDIPKSWVVVG